MYTLMLAIVTAASYAPVQADPEAPLETAADTAETGTIHVYVQDLEDEGVVRFVLFNSPEGFPMSIEGAVSVQDVVVSRNRAAFLFENLYHGDYAVLVLYSENGHFPQPGVGAGFEGTGGMGGP